MTDPTPEEQLADFITRYSPEVGALAHAALARMRARLPGAVELVYDNYNALVIGFGPTERASEAIFSIALYPRWVNLFFLQGAGLPDPAKLLEGTGNVVRRIALNDAADLDHPAVQELITAALQRAPRALDPLQPRPDRDQVHLGEAAPETPPGSMRVPRIRECEGVRDQSDRSDWSDRSV